MSLATDLTDRFLIVDRSAEVQQILAEARTHLTGRAVLGEVDPLIGSIEEYVPSQSWSQVLLRDHIVVDLIADFLDRVEPNLAPELRPVRGSFGPWLGRGTGSRVRWDAAMRRTIASQRDASPESVFARRLVGEVLSVAQRLFARHQGLTSALTRSGGGEFDDLDLINEVMAGVLSAHDERMIDLGLEP
ncbi:hypothetical protein O6R08_05935 [Cutibacterium equinum]|uniref:Uncharacterized protein n=1 Tax=Cutibacterium equinum TaxID=3016342 RepID=A0ABY7R2L3_9ACTN|nr:hypothetical protein [Cutibacterium equinum]WCC81102.1 hypothetical protein O6R08_05935 [Cutibacterium equinum]